MQCMIYCVWANNVFNLVLDDVTDLICDGLSRYDNIFWPEPNIV